MYSAYKSLDRGPERGCQICPSAYERRAGAWAKCSGSTVFSYVALRFRLYKVEFSSVQPHAVWEFLVEAELPGD